MGCPVTLASEGFSAAIGPLRHVHTVQEQRGEERKLKGGRLGCPLDS